MGLFITLEGPEGSGKTTAATRLIEDLKKEGYDAILSREPGGSKIAEEIRNVILKKENTALDKNAEALLFAASRRQHLVEIVLPALKKGKIVICDRFIDSSLAYQGYARKLGIDNVLNVNLFATEGKLPDLTVYFRIEAEKGLERIAKNSGREVNRLDLEKVDFHHLVCAGYEELLKRYPERIKPINAELDEESVYQELKTLVKEKIKESNIKPCK